MFAQKFESKSFIFPKGIRVVSLYSKKLDGVGIKYPPYGNLISYEFFFRDKLIFKFNTSDLKYLGYSMNLEILHDAMANTNMEIKVISKDDTEIIENLDSDFLFNDYDAFLSSIDHTTDQFEIRFDGTSFFKNILEERKKGRIIVKENLLHVIQDLVSKGLPIMETTIIPAIEFN
ncbi:hypothetical protein [Leptospira weilii]|nr:hypothetical protein [Leptospira weilii]